jgi:hypothetical protein
MYNCPEHPQKKAIIQKKSVPKGSLTIATSLPASTVTRSSQKKSRQLNYV